MTFHHRVDRAPAGGSVVGIDVEAPAPLLAVIARTYGPVCAQATRRIADRAATGW